MLASILTSLNDRDVFFIDEVHRLNHAVEEALYPAMEDLAFDFVAGRGAGAQTLRLSLNRFTVIAATTRAGALGGPLRDRFGVTFRLDYYDVGELTDIIRRSARLLKIAIDDDGAALLASRARGTPRVANRLLRRARDYAQVRAAGHIDVAAATAALDMLGIDAAGLDEMDRRVLAALCGPLRGHPVGVQTDRGQRAGGAGDHRGRRRALPDPPRHAGAHPARPRPHGPRLPAPGAHAATGNRRRGRHPALALLVGARWPW